MSSPILPPQNSTGPAAGDGAPARAGATAGATHTGAAFPLAPPSARGESSGATSGAGATHTGAAFPLAPPSARGESPHPFPTSPPSEVLDEMARAAQAHARLQAQGRELRFAHDAHSGRMTIEVRDGDGRVLRTLSPSQALDVAAGKPLD